MQLVRKVKWAYILVSIFMIILGGLFIIFPEISALTVCLVLGFLIILFGIIKLIGYFSKDLFQLAFQFDLAFGILALITGSLLLVKPAEILNMVPYTFGVIVLVDGVFKIQTAYDAKKFGLQYWWEILIMAILACLSGLFLIINPFGKDALMMLLGITLVVDGAQNLSVVMYTVNEMNTGKM